jgi:hypothetical protein
MTPYKTDTRGAHRIEWFHDSDTGAPWEAHEGHGPVSDWVGRDKRPGELVLSKDGNYTRYYNFQQACRIARKDGWNTKPYAFNTRRIQAAAAAYADYLHLKAWCDDNWWWCGIQVSLLRDTGESAAVWAIEDALDGSAERYHEDIIRELIKDVGP